MARNIPNHKTEDANPHAPKAAMPGGALGVPADNEHHVGANEAATAIGGRHVSPARHTPRESAPPRLFRVTEGPRRRDGNGREDPYISVVYDGAVTRIQPGKVYAEHQVDMDLLKRQGVKFEELDPPAAAAGG